jgi:hypothetical protein
MNTIYQPNSGLRSWSNLKTTVYSGLGTSTNWGTKDDLAAIEAINPLQVRSGDVATADDTGIVYRYDGTQWLIYIHSPVTNSSDFLKEPTFEGAYGLANLETYRYVTLSGTGYWIPEIAYLGGATREAWFDGDEDNTTLASQNLILLQSGGGTIGTDGTRIISSCLTSSDISRISRNNAAWNSTTGIYFRMKVEVTSFVFVDTTNTFAIVGQYSDGSNFVRLGLLGSILSGNFLGFNLFGSSEFVMNPTVDVTGTELLIEGLIKPQGTTFWNVSSDGVQIGFCRQNAGIASASKSFALGASTSSLGAESVVVAYRDFVLVSFPTA